MNIGSNFLSFNFFSSLNRSLSDGSLSRTASAKSTLQVASSDNVIKDEYVPSVASLRLGANKIEINKTEATATEKDKPTIAELESILVDFLKEHSTLSYNQMALEIDADGKFVSGDQSVFSITENSEGNAELTQKFLDILNNIKVGDQSLGEAFLEAYADEFGIDLNAAKMEGEEVKSLQFNFSHGIVGDKFVSESTSVSLHIGDFFYSIDDKTLEKGVASKSGGVSKLGKVESDSRAKSEALLESLSGPKSNDSVTFKPTSFMTNMFGTQQASSPLSGMSQDLNRMILEGTINRVLEAHNIDLKDGDSIALSLNAKGEFSINVDESSIWGASGEEIEGLCYNLEKALNATQTEDGKSLGQSLLEQFSADMGFDLDEARNDENFSISFSMKHNSKSGKNEIYNAQLRSLANMNHPESKDKDDDQFMPDTRDLDVAIKQILKDNGIELKSGDSIGFDFGKEGVFTFDSEASHIDGLDKDALVEIGKILDTGLNTIDFRSMPSWDK